MMTKPKQTDLVHYYLVNDLPSAHVPANGSTLDLLQKQGLVALCQLVQAK